MRVAVVVRIGRSLPFFVLGVGLSSAFISTPCGQGSSREESASQEMHWGRDALSAVANPYRVEETIVRNGGHTFRTSVLQVPSPEGRLTDSVIVEEETIRESPTKSRRIQKLFNQLDTGRVLVEMLEEETIEQGGTRTATRVTSKPELNGSLQVVRREIEKTVRRGPESSATETTVFLPSVNGGFESVTQICQTESRDQQGKQRIDRERLERYASSGAWTVQERVTRVVERQREVEETYRPDPLGQFPLWLRSITKRSEDPDGQRHEVTEIFSRTLGGSTVSSDNELRLDRRIIVHYTPQPDQGTKVVRQIEQRRLDDPRGSLTTIEKAVAVSYPDGGTREEIQTTAGGADAIRVRRVIETRKTVEE